jgi:hypothetical protein
MKNSYLGAAIVTVILTSILAFSVVEKERPVDEVKIIKDRVYELRTYTTHPGKLDNLHERFTNHTLQLFSRHGMVNVGYWVPVDQENTLIYILSHNSQEAAVKSWEAFINDPEWQQAYEASHVDGPIVKEVESVFMKAVPYSQIR